MCFTRRSCCTIQFPATPHSPPTPDFKNNARAESWSVPQKTTYKQPSFVFISQKGEIDASQEHVSHDVIVITPNWHYYTVCLSVPDASALPSSTTPCPTKNSTSLQVSMLDRADQQELSAPSSPATGGAAAVSRGGFFEAVVTAAFGGGAALAGMTLAPGSAIANGLLDYPPAKLNNRCALAPPCFLCGDQGAHAWLGRRLCMYIHSVPTWCYGGIQQHNSSGEGKRFAR